MADSSQKFIARNRAPRVQIEYDVELYGSEKKVQLPFVMGVMSDLVGKSKVAQPAVADRKFLEIDVDNFDERMQAMAPRAAFTVPNTLSGEGNLAIDLTFEKLSDFSPGAIAAKVDALRPLLEARSQLTNLMAYMDGKSGAEALIETILGDSALLSALSSDAPGSEAGLAAALDSLRAAELPAPEVDQTGDVLADLRAQAPEQIAQKDASAGVLAELSAQAHPEEKATDEVGEVLAGLATAEVAEAQESSAADALASLAAVPTEEVQAKDNSAVLQGLAAQQQAEVEDTSAAAALESLAAVEIADPIEENAAGVLEDLAAQEMVTTTDNLADEALDTLGSVEVPEPDAADATAEILDQLGAVETGVEVEDPGADILDALASVEIADAPEPDISAALASVAPLDTPETEEDGSAEVFAELSAVEVSAEPDPDLGDVLGSLRAAEPEAAESDLTDILATLETADTDSLAEDGLDDLLADLADDDGDTDPSTDVDTEALDDTADDLDDLLGDLGLETEGEASDDGLDDLLSGLEDDAAAEPDAEAEDDGLDGLLEGLGADDGDLDDLLGDLDDDGDAADDNLDLDDLLGGLDDAEAAGEEGPDLDDLLSDEDASPKSQAAQASLFEEPEFAYGSLSADRPEPQKLVRKRFRLAILGDFSGRAAKGQIEIGDALANRRAVLLDPDTVDEVIESFATELILPIGKDGTGMSIKLGELDDLHPDELYEKVALFSELVGLRQQLQSGVTADHAAQTLRAWGEANGKRVRPPKPRSGGNSVPADRRLSAFQQLIGDAGNQLGQASPIEDLLARVVGPHIRALPDPDTSAMIGAVDAALSDAMRMVLHHPEFQSVEAQWRSLDLIARSVDCDDSLEVMLYDISAEELAADLAAAEDLTESGLVRLLTTEPLDPDIGRGGYSALIGLYGFEETPPHAELLGRIARVAAHVDAPFFAALSPTFLDTAKEDLPKIVGEAWDTLRGMAEAGHLGLVAPRFLLRRPYGAKSEPIYAFEFEEFTETEGLRGMLWANPVVLVAILLARSFKQNGAAMDLGQIMSLGEVPYHYVNDRYGDQVALPCTERNIDLDKIAQAQARGVMAISAIKGRDEIRLTSFASLKGGEILGPWTGAPAPPPSPPDPKAASEASVAEVNEQAEDDDLGLDDLGLDDLDLGADDDGGNDLDDLLAGFGDDDETEDEDGMDAELAALLDDL